LAHELSVAVLIPRIRTLGVRLSEDEYLSLEKFCVKSGARSISDVARTAICNFVSRGNEENELASTVSQNVAQVKELEQKIEALTTEISLLKANSVERDGHKAAEAHGEAGSPGHASLLDRAITEPEA
jgi:uncharacterized small protein (DUF1192 family)